MWSTFKMILNWQNGMYGYKGAEWISKDKMKKWRDRLPYANYQVVVRLLKHTAKRQISKWRPFSGEMQLSSFHRYDQLKTSNSLKRFTDFQRIRWSLEALTVLCRVRSGGILGRRHSPSMPVFSSGRHRILFCRGCRDFRRFGCGCRGQGWSGMEENMF